MEHLKQLLTKEHELGAKVHHAYMSRTVSAAFVRRLVFCIKSTAIQIVVGINKYLQSSWDALYLS